MRKKKISVQKSLQFPQTNSHPSDSTFSNLPFPHRILSNPSDSTFFSWSRKIFFFSEKKAVLDHHLDKLHDKCNFLVVSTRQWWKSFPRLMPAYQSNKMAYLINHDIDQNQFDLTLTPGIPQKAVSATS